MADKTIAKPAPKDPTTKGRARRVRKNLRQGMALAWAASPRSLIRYSLLGMVNATMPPVAVFLGASLVNRIAEARAQAIEFNDLLPIVIGLWIAAGAQRAIGAYMGYGRNLFVRRVELEAERRLLSQASKVDIGHFDNSDWHDRLARAKRDVSWRPGDLTWSVLGLSGNIVTIALMASLLASLHYLLVVLALAAAALSLFLERRITSRLYEFFYKGTPEEQERAYMGDLLAQPRATKEIRAYVLADYLLGRHRDLSIEIDDERVVEALRNSRSEWLVKKMPNGLDSKVGRLFEGGHDLSGGEWQRLALARIMYRDADIWILDEPTSSLDPEAEAAIFAELKENLRGRIGIVISHQFSTVRIADRIAVVADGRITELGTHEELLAAEGRYAQLFELQAAGYR
jgi:ABC-type multidrug transport system fused ATPase/permease subunit